jgi:18S rRNA (guanine1575-N7)-methyltransferase
LDFDDWQVATTMSRPEYLAPPEIYYNDQEAKKYLTSTRMNEIQRSLTERLVSFVTC